ncbi:hypothetical protein F2Q68_00008825 [Brassica cretica]|uniref:Uncharacterized protein n=1 Tax=Brassica cretica TaxID=69181 RepID=A0A8S9KSC0_BRACR|nr:hypothetical protein F2Q68_00008825 [Brassica cretica]
MYLPRHNCTVTGTHGVHYCGFPIAMKVWMGTSESLPSHVFNGNKISLSLWDCEPGRTGIPKGKLCKGSSVGSVELVGLSWTDSDKAAGLVIRDHQGKWRERLLSSYQNRYKTDPGGYWTAYLTGTVYGQLSSGTAKAVIE